MSGGTKHDVNKPRFDLLPGDALQEVVGVLTYGAVKYGDRNWEKGISFGRLFGAAMRHLWAWHRGNDLDEETNHNHLAHAACCILFMLALQLRGNKSLDDRPVTEGVIND